MKKSFTIYTKHAVYIHKIIQAANKILDISCVIVR